MHKIEQLQEIFEQYLKDNLFKQEPQTLYQPANYILSTGGKRIRPVLVLMSYQLFANDTTKALPVAMAVEVFHNFSLVHDDIMDQATSRRGQPTVHQKFGLNAGILSGDAMLIHAFEFLFLSPVSIPVSQIVHVLSKVAIKVCEGQQYDIDFEQRNDVSLSDYLKMIELKTAALLAGSLQLGAMVAETSTENQKHLYEFGRLTGIAFQLQDDLLDAFGDPSKVGKRLGGDIVQNKKTGLYIKALELASPSQKQQLITLFNTTPDDPTQKVKEVLTIFQDLQIPKIIANLRDEFQQQAHQHLHHVDAPEERKKLLHALADALLAREL